MWLSLLAAPVALAALVPARGPLPVELNLGPGDSPYLSGFWPRYEIEQRVATHWTRYDARIALPLRVEGGPLAISWRYARVLPQTAVVDVSLAEQPIDRFECRGGRVEERRVELGAVPPTPLELHFAVDSHDRLNKGLRLDRVRFELGAGTRVGLSGAARWSPALLVLIGAGLLRGLGWSRLRSAALVAPPALAAVVALQRDPWLLQRLLSGVPITVAIAGGLGVGLGRLLAARGQVALPALRLLGALALATLIGRCLLVNHPDFYYPDLRTHARLAEVLREAGLDFFRDPARYIAEHGVWRVEAHGREYAFPYSPAFHLPIALADPGFDAALLWMKQAGAAISVVPLVLVWALARRLGLSPIGALLMAVVPSYVSRLSWAFLPALLGHAVDVALLYWLAGQLPRIAEPGVLLRGALGVAASQLAYVSGTLNSAALVGSLALVDPLLEGRQPRRRALAILAMGALGALVALLLYYRAFLPMAADIAARALGAAGEAGASRYAVQGFFAVAFARTHDFFGWVYPPLALVALVALLRRRAPGAGLLAAWLLAYLLLLLGRAKLPDVFTHGHETLLVTPLVCLLAGHGLSRLAQRDLAGRLAAAALLGYLTLDGLSRQWAAMADQLGNAL